MPGPVIIDDGGSMRIRRVEGNLVGEMDELLYVDSGSLESHPSIIKDNFSQVLIVWQNKDGVPASHKPTFKNDVEVVCQFNQKIRLKNAGGELQIKVIGGPMEPMVHAKQQNKKRSYVVSNSGPIEKVWVDNVLEYDTVSGKAGNGPASIQIEKPIVFTSVVLS